MNLATYYRADGTELRYLDHGPKDGTAVVFLHGYTDSSFSFSRILPLLPAGWRAIVPDQRGHGCSERPPGPYSLDAFAEDVVALLSALNIPSAVIAGHSMGSFVARRIAAISPNRVNALVLIGSAPSARNEAVLGLAKEVLGFTDPVDPEFIREFQASTVHREVPSEFMERIVADSAKVPARIWKDALAGLLEAEHMPLPECPTLIVGGKRDTVFRESEQLALSRQIPQAEIRLYSEVGHAPHWEIPSEFVDDLVAFERHIASGTLVSAIRSSRQ